MVDKEFCQKEKVKVHSCYSRFTGNSRKWVEFSSERKAKNFLEKFKKEVGLNADYWHHSVSRHFVEW